MPRIEDKLVIYCMRVGQGDCTIVQCPDGHVVMIDLGSTKAEPWREEGVEPMDTDEEGDDQELEYDPGAIFLPTDVLVDLFTGGDNHLNTLILTHQDRDHYNWVGQLFDHDVVIDKVYHSGNFNKYGCGSQWGGNGKANDLLVRMCENDYSRIRGVTCNADKKEFYSSKDEHIQSEVMVDIVDGTGIDQYSDKGIKIYQRDQTAIYILCGNVSESIDVDDYPDEGSRKRRKLNVNVDHITRTGQRAINMASIVTLIEHRDKQFVIAADAVDTTEKFILNQYPNLQNVELLRAAHHGSATEGSSHTDFIRRMNPRTLFISAPYLSTKHRHPRAELIQRFIEHANRLRRLQVKANKRAYGCWRKHLLVEEKKRGRKHGRTYTEDRFSIEDAYADVRTTGSHSDTLLEYD